MSTDLKPIDIKMAETRLNEFGGGSLGICIQITQCTRDSGWQYIQLTVEDALKLSVRIRDWANRQQLQK